MSNDVENPVVADADNRAAKPQKGSFWRLLGYGGLGFVLLVAACWAIGLSNANRGVRAVFRSGGVAQELSRGKSPYENANLYDPFFVRSQQWPTFHWLQIDRLVGLVYLYEAQMKPEEFPVLDRFPKLYGLTIRDDQLKHVTFLAKKKLPEAELSIVFGNLDLDGIQEFQHLPRLHVAGKTQPINLEPLAKLANLKELSITLVESIPKGSLLPIGKCPALEKLEIRGSALKADQLIEIADAPSIHTITVKLSMNGDWNGLSEFQKLRKLKAIVVEGVQQDNSATVASEIAKISQLESIKLRDCNMNPDDVEKLRNLPNIKELKDSY